MSETHACIFCSEHHQKRALILTGTQEGQVQVMRRELTCLTLCSICGHKLRRSEGTVYKHLLKGQRGISNIEFVSEHFVRSLAHSVDKYLVNE